MSVQRFPIQSYTTRSLLLDRCADWLELDGAGLDIEERTEERINGREWRSMFRGTREGIQDN